MFSCVLTHVFHLIQLVHDFLTDQSLKDVLQRDGTLGSAEFIGHQGEVLLRFKEMIQGFLDALLQANTGDGLHQIVHRRVVFVVGGRTQDASTEHEAEHVVGPLSEDRHA